MLKKSQKTIALISAMTLVLAGTVGCGSDPETQPDFTSSEAATEAPTEEVTEAPTDAETEPETEAPTDAPTEAETEAPTEAETAEVMTKLELVRIINSEFGTYTDGTDEDEVAKAQAWDVIDKDGFDGSEPITIEFVVESAVRATGFLGGGESLASYVTCALEKGIIDNANLEKIDISETANIVHRACEAWTNKSFDNTEITVTLQDGVIDLTEKISAADCTFGGDTVKVPESYISEYAIAVGSVVIFPKNDAGQGGAYKVLGITGGELSVTPATMEEVYASISSH